MSKFWQDESDLAALRAVEADDNARMESAMHRADSVPMTDVEAGIDSCNVWAFSA